MNEILKLDHIQKFYGNHGNITKAINDISFSVSEGEFVGIMGASGSGKTTLLNCISTIDTVSAGHIYLDGTDVTEIKEKALARFRRENLGFVFQDFNLLDTLTISENIALALTINNVPVEQVEGKVVEMAGTLNITDILDKYPYVISLVIAVICFSIVGVVLYNFANINGVYAGDIPEEISNRYQVIAIVAAIVGIFALYNAVVFVITVIRRRKNWKNRNINSVLLGNLFQKVSSTAKILSISTLAITIALVAFVLLPMLAEITTGYLDYRMPYDVMIYNTYMYIDKMEDIPEIDFSFVEDILQEHGITVSEDISQRSYFVWERDFNTVDTREYWRDLPRLAMSISDYNDMRQMAGMEPVSLAENEFFMHLDYEMDRESVEATIGGSRAIELDDGAVLYLADVKIYNDPLGTYLFHNGESVLVFPDSVCENLHLARTCYYANTETAVPYDLCDTVREEIAETFRSRYSYLFDHYEAKYQSDRHYISFIDPIRFRTQESNDVALTATSVRLLGIYSGIIFFIVCMTVLALHLTTDSIDQNAQYRILYQLGTNRDDIAKMVSKQSLCYFFTPLPCCLHCCPAADLLICCSIWA